MFSCEYYIGLNQQPDFTSKIKEEGLNIFGILRPDAVSGFNRSFVYVHRILPALEPEGFYILRSALIKVERIIENEVSDQINFYLTPPESAFADTAYRPLTYFSPLEGEHYRITCKYEGMNDAVGETIIPFRPQINTSSLEIDANSISFSLLPDSLCGMIEIYQIRHNAYIALTRFIPYSDKETNVELKLPFDVNGSKLLIYSYDHNMAAYIGNSNISLNFNKYRTSISTLESGYGVFGSMNFTEFELP